jgi:arylsulfatase
MGITWRRQKDLQWAMPVFLLLTSSQEISPCSVMMTVPYIFSVDETLDIGEDRGTPILEDYAVPFRFTGDIEKVTIELKK